MKFSRPQKKPLVAILVKRTVFFFFSISLLTSFLYAVGTRQGFMEITQIILLRLLIIIGIFLSIGALYGGILDAGLIIFKGRRRYIMGIVSYLLLVIFGVAISLTASFILVLAGGNAA